jgi:hypothetical protein
VIVVVGSPTGQIVEGRIRLAGIAAATARAAAETGAHVQLLGRVGDDASADLLLLDLAAGGIGHVAVLRDPARPTPIAAEDEIDAELDAGAGLEAGDSLDADDVSAASRAHAADPPIALDAGDVELGLRYLTDFAVIVLVPPADAAVTRVTVDGAGWASAQLILVVEDSSTELDVPPDTIVLEAPPDDPDGTFATFVGRLAAALDAGGSPAEAFAGVAEAAGWSATSGS